MSPSGRNFSPASKRLVFSRRQFDVNIHRLALSETGEPAGPTEWGFRRPDGSTGFVYSTIFPVATRDGVKRFICMDVDVTARKRAESLQDVPSRSAASVSLEKNVGSRPDCLSNHRSSLYALLC